MLDEKINTNETEEGVPVCEKCGNVMIREDEDYSDVSFDGASPEEFERAQDKQQPKSKEGGAAVWVCPHCQGEIDFLGGEDE